MSKIQKEKREWQHPFAAIQRPQMKHVDRGDAVTWLSTPHDISSTATGQI